MAQGILPRPGRGGIGGLVTQAYRSRLGIFLQSVLIGVISGFVVLSFRLALEAGEGLRERAYLYLRQGPTALVVAWSLGLVLLGIFLGWIATRFPMTRGSGIPQIKGAFQRRFRLQWLPEMPLKWLGAVLGIGAGLSLGREGPSVQLGAYSGKAVLGIFRRPATERRYLLTSGAAAGLAAAFNAPLAGVIFAVEELHRYFSPLLLACAMGASVAGDLVAGRFFGLKPSFTFPSIEVLGLERLPWVVIFGVVAAFGADLFKRALYAGQDFYARLRIPPMARPVVPLLASVPLGLAGFDLLGGGHHLVESLATEHFALGVMLSLFAGKLLFTALSYGTGSSGGIFLPLLVAGALLGDAYGSALAALGAIPETETLNFLIIGMAAFFTGVVRAPVTGAVLVIEMSGNFNHFSSIIAACLVAYVVTDLIRSRAVYDVLLERIDARFDLPKDGSGRTIVEAHVAAGSALSNRFIRNVPWPCGALVVGVQRGEAELVPRGDTEIKPGDVIIALVDEARAAEAQAKLEELGSG
ncbi:MAG: ClC family H(+)/Cl(-) exchange transporter [Spirochaetales bacterium]|nr:ClC family H(+)/Cl(-) exchange transporter [Spirochaetales bacterium]